jgi:hypothetical protein
MTNILVALKSLASDPITDIGDFYKSSNRINNVGEALEAYIKDLFCSSTSETNLEKKLIRYNEEFSYLGNQNNPPDIMIKGGDAIEVKKIESNGAGIALNSSYPKDKLDSDSPMITQACRDCEDWRQKDLIYAIGSVNKNKLRNLWFVYGDCYAANSETYERIKNKISSGINELQDVEFSETNELGRVNKVDPLGITYLRIRGMWHIQNPSKVFDYLVDQESGDVTVVHTLLLKEKYYSFPEKDRTALETYSGDLISISDVKIKSPNNPANLLEAKLVKIVI